jgi:hypothetical protein
MKDPLFNSLAERFTDHAMDVDPGTWSAITGKLAVASGSSLSGLLQEKFTGHEAPVDPHVWTNISSQIGHGAAAGVGSTAGWWTAGIAATLVAGGMLLYTMGGEPTAPALAEKAPIVAPATTEPALVNEQASAATVTEALPSDRMTTAGAGVQPTPSRVQEPVRNRAPEHNAGSNPQETPAGGDENKRETLPPPTEQGKQAVTTVLQDIVDNYVTSPEVVVYDKVPPPAQKEMPSQAVHPYHDEPDVEPVTEPEATAAPEMAIFIPTAFSPNFDGVNDELAVSVQNYQKAVVRIFSATNDRLVFSADNLEARWNGLLMNSGDRCEPGMYFYALEVTDAQGRTWSKGEVVRLFR